MKFLNHNLFTGDITVNGTTTLSTATGITRATGDNTTHLATTAFVKAQDYATNTALGNYVPLSRTLTINNVTYDLSANRSWTIGTSDYTSVVKHAVKAEVAITKGQAVYVTSADGTNMIVGLASNASEATSSKTMGLAETTVAANGFTNVVTEGLLAGLNTVGANTGDPVWLGTGGNLIYGLLNKPYAPAHLVFIGIVTRVNANNGEIFVKVQNGFELKEIHDVDLITVVPVNGEILGFNGTLWVNKTIAGWLGYTPANASGTTNYLSKFTGTTTLGNSQIFDNGTNVGIGTASPAEKLAVAGNIRSAGNVIASVGLGYGNYISMRHDDTNGYITITRTINAGHLILEPYGNVGIGTSVPANKLVVTSDASPTSENSYAIAAASASDPAYKTVIGYDFTNDIGLIAAVRTGIGWRNISIPQGNLGIGTTSPNAKLEVDGSFNVKNGDGNISHLNYGDTSINYFRGVTYFDTNSAYFTGGNVGIGTTSPANKLQVANGDMSITSGYSFILADTDTNWRLGRNIISPVESVYLNSNTFEFVAANASDQGWQFINDDGYPVLEIGAATGSRNVWVNAGNLLVPTGSVGIGTASPATPLHVTGGASGSGGWNRTATLAATYPALIFNSNGTKWGGMAYDYSAAMRFWVNANNDDIFAGTLAMSILNNGNVGIGTSSPGTKLDVNGVITATGGTSTQWNTAYGWGNHAGLYLGINSKASDSELLDGIDSSRFVYGNSGTRRGTNLISNWNQNDYPDVAFLSAENEGTNAPSSDYSYGMQYSFHRSGAPYRTQFVTSLYSDLDIWVRNSRDSDVWTSWKRLWHSNDFTSTNISNWNTAYGWGNHASQSYATQTYVNTAIANLVDSAPATLDTLNELAAALGDDPNFATTVATSIGTKQNQLNGTGFVKVSGTTVSYDNSTYYLASNPSGFISSYTETDTLATVTGRGASTSTNSVFTGGLQARKNQTDNSYTTAALWTESYGNTTTGIAFHISGNVGKFLEMRTNGILYWDNAQVWTAGTLTNLNQLTNGPGYITGYTETDTLNSVTGRGNTTSNSVRFGSHVDLSPTGSAFRFYDGTTFRGGLGLDDWAHSGSAANITAYVNGDNNFFISTSGVKRAQFNSGAAIFRTYSADTAYNIRLTGGDQINAYYNDAVATLHLQYHNGNGGTLNVGNGKLTVNTAGSVVASGDMRAPIFYDSNDTNYYLDLSAATSSYAAGVFRQNDGKFVRDSHHRTFSGFSDYYPSGNAGWYRVAEITLTTNCAGAVLFGTLYDHRYDGADAYQVSIVARAECGFTSNNESHYINVGCTILGSTNHVDYKSKIRVVLSASSAGSRTYEVQFYETAWNQDTWQLETTGWTIYTTPQAPRAAVGTPNVYYVSNQNADYQRANTATYSPVYYDSDDTTYYADFNSTGGSAIKVRGGILTGPNPSWSQFLQLGGDGNNSSHATVAVTNGNLHIDAKNGSATYINHYYGNKIYLGSGGAGGGTYTHSNFSLAGNLNLGGGDGDASHRLQVIGNALVQGTQGFNASGETASLYIGDTASEIRAVYDGGLDFYQNSVHRVRIESGTGNFGIGTSDPNYKLHVVGNAYINETLFVNQQTTIEDNLLVTQGIGQNNLIGRPAVMWSASGTSTGAVMIKFPGTTANYGMVHAVVDIYEYNGNTVSTIIIGGHNWGGAWYSYGANLIGQTDKQVRLAVVDGSYAIVIGDNSSSWSYGQVVLRKIQNGGYYQNAMNVYDGYIASQTTSLSASWISGDLRRLVVSGVITANGGNSGEWNTAYSWGNHASAGYITGYTETDTLATVTGRGATTTTPIIVTASEGREVAVYMASSYGTDDLVSGHEYGWYADHWRLGMTRSGGAAGADFVIQWNGARRLSLTNGGNLTVTGTISATNFSGSSSGTNTGDQTNISGNAATATNAVAASNLSLTSLGTASVNVNNGSSAVYRNENGSGGNLSYAPVLHLGGGDTMWQIQGDYYDSSTLRWRAGYNGTWYAWRQIYHSGNFTDNSSNWNTAYGWGNHASAGYAAASSLANYLPLAGGTLTGTFSVSSASIGMDWWRDTGGTYMEFYGTNTATRKLRLQGSDGSNYAQWFIDAGNQQIYGDVAGVRNFVMDSTTAYIRHGGADKLWGGSDGTRNSGWAYHNNNDTGLHWPNNGWHFYPKDVNDMYMRSGSVTNVAIAMNTAGTNRGYVYAEDDNTIGFLNNSRSWSFRTYANGNATVYGYLTVNGAGTSSSIYMNDSDEGQREIHCNSNRIGFLTQAGAWGAYCDDAGNWTAANFSGSSSGTNTGDQTNISGNAATATSATQVVTIQDDPPTGVNGKLWWESDTGKLKVYYGTSSAWVDATPVPDMSLYYAKAGGPISGDVTIQQTLTVVGNTLIQGTLTETSDISLKENILPLESSLDKVMKLNGVSFNKKATPNVKEIGFIAQEVEAVIPDLVTETNEGIKTVSYSRVTAVLVETIKEQQAQIDAQHAQIEELKNMVNMLAEKLNSL